MKLRISFLSIFILLLATAVSAQTLMLSVRKGRVKSEMMFYPQWKCTVSALDYLEYQNGNHVISYRFEDKHCTEACIVMPKSEVSEFIRDKEENGCWHNLGSEWVYNTNVFDTDVIVVKYDSSESNFVTFCYKFRE